jgi:hypothetical protein
VVWYIVTLWVGFGMGFLLAAAFAAVGHGEAQDDVQGTLHLVDSRHPSATPVMRSNQVASQPVTSTSARARAAAAWLPTPGPV